MRRETSRAHLRATESIRKNPWAKAGDQALVRGMLRRHRGAWREFFDCFGQVMHTRIAGALRRFSPRLSRASQIEKVEERIEAFLKSDRMAALRAFDAKRGSLSSWAGRLAEQATRLHLAELADPPRDGYERRLPSGRGELREQLF